jgi:hypothetical protein
LAWFSSPARNQRDRLAVDGGHGRTTWAPLCAEIKTLVESGDRGMTLQIIGTGFGRTGTLSLKNALEELGVGSCYHMVEVAKHTEHARTWAAAARGEQVDWKKMFAGYSAAVDWPAAAFWKEILAVHEGARVILTVRESSVWYASFRDTILEKVRGPAPPKGLPVRAIYDLCQDVILERTFEDRTDMSHAIDVFENHNREVIATIEPRRLLVYDLSEGWEPLCRFLDLPVPGNPFPHLNTRSSFQAGCSHETRQPFVSELSPTRF